MNTTPSTVSLQQSPKPILYHHEPQYDIIRSAVIDKDDHDDDDDARNCDRPSLSSHLPLPPPEHEEVGSSRRCYCCYYHHRIIRYMQQQASFVASFLCGQCIAMIVTSMNTSSYLLISQQHIHTNFFQLFFVYVLLVVLNQNYYYNDHDDSITNPHENLITNQVANVKNKLQPQHCGKGSDDIQRNRRDDDDDDDDGGDWEGIPNDDNDDDDVDGTVPVCDSNDNDDNNNNNHTTYSSKQSHPMVGDSGSNLLVQWNDIRRNVGNTNRSLTTSTSFSKQPYQCLHQIPTTTISTLDDDDIAVGSDQSTGAPPSPEFATVTSVANNPILYQYSISWFNCRERCWTNYTVLQLHLPIYYYILISMMDIVSNVLSIYSFHYTTLTSTTLLGSISIPSTMFFARILLRKVFTPVQYIGIVLCIIGGCYTIYIDSVSDTDVSNDANTVGYINTSNASTTALGNSNIDNTPTPSGQQQYIGDIMALTAAVMYGLGDCIAEYFIKYINRKEYLYMLGIFGILFTAMIVPIFEYNAVKELFTDTIITPTGNEQDNDGNNNSTDIIHHVKIISLFIWFIASVTLYYMMEAIFLMYYDATLLNLSMQSVNLWAYMIMYLINPDGLPSSNFFIALLFVVTGVCFYEMGSIRHHPYMEVQRSNDSGIDDNCNMKSFNTGCLHRDSRMKPRRDSEVEIVHGPNEQIPVNYQSLQTL